MIAGWGKPLQDPSDRTGQRSTGAFLEDCYPSHDVVMDQFKPKGRHSYVENPWQTSAEADLVYQQVVGDIQYTVQACMVLGARSTSTLRAQTIPASPVLEFETSLASGQFQHESMW